MRGIHRSPVDYPHKGQWHGALSCILTCAWTNGSANNRDAGDLRRSLWRHCDGIMYEKSNPISNNARSMWHTEHKSSSIWQLCCDWWHRKLPQRQLTVPPVTTKLWNWRYFVPNTCEKKNVPISWRYHELLKWVSRCCNVFGKAEKTYLDDHYMVNLWLLTYNKKKRITLLHDI